MSEQEDRPARKSPDVLSLERLVFFSDAVMAISLTLLAFEIRLPEVEGEVSWATLRATGPDLVGFLISFVVVGIYWIAHHRTFHFIRRCDRPLICLNLCSLLCVCLLPFATNLVSRYGATVVPNLVYVALVVLLGVFASATWSYAARGGRLTGDGLDPAVVRALAIRPLVAPAVFLLSIPLLFVSPGLARATWWLPALILVLGPLPVGGAERRHPARSSVGAAPPRRDGD